VHLENLHLRNALHEVVMLSGLAQSGSATVPVTEKITQKDPPHLEDTPQVRWLPESYGLHFRLPRCNGGIDVDAAALREKLPRFGTNDFGHDDREELKVLLRRHVDQGAKLLRGRALLELALGQWDLADQVVRLKKEGWQDVERAALALAEASDRLMEIVKKERK
jgi:hypothetical protein